MNDIYSEIFAEQNRRYERSLMRQSWLLGVSSIVLVGALIWLSFIGLRWMRERVA